jgi:hypothetical protein
MALCGDPSQIIPNWQVVPAVWNVYIRAQDVDALYAEIQEPGAPDQLHPRRRSARVP